MAGWRGFDDGYGHLSREHDAEKNDDDDDSNHGWLGEILKVPGAT
jgi:hypothetical protein